MANIQSAKKRCRQTIVRTQRNMKQRSRMRTFIKKVEQFLIKKDVKNISQAFQHAESEIMHSVSKGILHRKTASRKVSRLSRRVKMLVA